MEAAPALSPTSTPEAPRPPVARRHRRFSLRRVITLAGGTFTQLVRMKVFYFMAIFSVLVIVSSFAFDDLQTGGQVKLLKDISLAAMSLFSMLFAVAGTALLIPRDIEDRTLYTILCKPVPRIEYLLGKMLGVIWLIFISLILMNVLFSVVLHLKDQAVLQAEIEVLKTKNYPSREALEAEIALAETASAQRGVTWNLQNAVAAIFLKSVVLTAVTLLMSTFASSTIFTIMSSLAIMVIGHAQSMAREVFLREETATFVPKLIAGVVALLFPDFKNFDVIDAVVTGTLVPFSIMAKMVGLTLIYVTIYAGAAWTAFSGKEL